MELVLLLIVIVSLGWLTFRYYGKHPEETDQKLRVTPNTLPNVSGWGGYEDPAQEAAFMMFNSLTFEEPRAAQKKKKAAPKKTAVKKPAAKKTAPKTPSSKPKTAVNASVRRPKVK